jgi:hypothetical protein
MSPLANSYIQATDLNEMERFYPLHVLVCEDCFLVQLPRAASPEEIFSDYAYFSSYSDTWLQHARAYAEAVTKRLQLGHHSWIVEIASNDGYLLQYFVEKQIPVLGIEPAANVAKAAIQRGIPTEIAFFSDRLARELTASGRRADLIVANNVFAHVPDLTSFISGLKILLAPGGVATLEFPHLMCLMEHNEFDTIYHEHFSYFSLTAASSVIKRYDLTVFDVEELTTHGGSLRMWIRHQEDVDKLISGRVTDLLSREENAGFTTLEHYLSFNERVKAVKRMLLKFLVAAKEAGKSVAAYGAPAKGNTLLNYCGIRTDLVEFTVDRSPHKQGQFLPGTHIPIYHPDKIREARPDYLLILPWNLKDEVMAQMDYIRNWNGKFVLPIPEVQVLS